MKKALNSSLSLTLLRVDIHMYFPVFSMLKAWLKAKKLRRESKTLLKKLLIRFSSFNYIQFCQRWMDSRVSDDPYTAVTSIGWAEGGYRQFLFLKHKGLKPHHKFLDIGCGTLSLGNYLIEYLNKGNYVGMDICAKAIIKGKELVEGRIGTEKFKEKQPVLIQNKDLIFSEVVGQVFDFVMAFSVFDHLPIEYFEEFILNVRKVINYKSKIFLTVILGEKNRGINGFPYSNYEYNFDFLQKLLLLNGYRMKIIDTNKHWDNLLKLVLLELFHK